VNTKTSAYAAWNSITSLLKLPSDPSKWEQVQVLSKSYNIPTGFLVAVGNTSSSLQVTGSGRDTYMKHITASMEASGSYGGFSGTLQSSFGLTEDTTEAYSFGSMFYERQLYSLTLPNNLDGLLDPTFKGDLEGAMLPNDFYERWGTHYTSSILMGAKASLSLRSQLKTQYSDSTFKADLSAAYDGIVATFQTKGTYTYTNKSSSQTYESTSSLVLVGGDTTKSTMKNWLSTIQDFPEFIDYNTASSGAGLVPIYKLLPSGSRRDQLEAALPDYLNPPLRVRIFSAASTLTEYPTATVVVPNHYKILSGGAKVAFEGYGELLTASYPISNNQWTAKAKDHYTKDKAILTVYAVAVYDPHDWLDVEISRGQSDWGSAPYTSARLDSDYAMTGGGAQTVYMAVAEHDGHYLTASLPDLYSNSWLVASKDHIDECRAMIIAYAIGVKWSSAALTRFPRLQKITSHCVQASSNSVSWPSYAVAAPASTIMVGGGVRDDYGTGYGNILYESYPRDANTWSASGKDHKDPSPATLTVYAIGVRNMVVPSLSSS